MNEKVRVSVQFLFNQREQDLFAYFPFEVASVRGSRDVLHMAYSHVGQHGSAHIDYVNESKHVPTEEYQDLKEELESLGYILDVIVPSPVVDALFAVAIILFESYDKLPESSMSYKEYSYLSYDLDTISIGFRKEMPDGDRQQELYDDRFQMTEQEAIDVLQHRIRSILDDLKE